MSDFIYNEETRIHTLNGKVIPSVSNIVEPLSMDYSKAHPGKLERKRDLGNAFHDCIRLFLANDLDIDSVDDDLKLPMQQFEEFWTNDKDFEENAIYDWKLRRYDPVCDPLRMAGYNGLVKNKPFSLSGVWRLIETPFCNRQLKYCGKPDLVIGMPPRRLIVVEFSLDGGYRVHDADKKQSWSFFRLLLERFHKNKEWDTKIEQWKKSC